MIVQAGNKEDNREFAVCPHCGTLHPTKAAFCPKSGKPLETDWWRGAPEHEVHEGGFCAVCGKALPIGAVTCPYCGWSVPGSVLTPLVKQNQATLNQDSVAKPNLPIISLAFRVALMLGIFVFPWFEVLPVYGVASVNLFSIGDAFSSFGSMGQSLVSLTGETSSVLAALQFLGMLCFVFGAAPIVILAKEMYDIVNRREVGKIGYIATLCIALATALIILACNSSVSDYLSSYMGISGQEYLSLASGWWIVIIVAAAALYFDREQGAPAVEDSEPRYTSPSPSSDVLEKRRCTVCNEELQDEARFCPNCGKKVSEMGLPPIKRCPRCQALVNDDYMFCPKCSKQLKSSQ